MDKYNGNFTSRDDVAREFNCGTGNRYAWENEPPFVPNADFPTDDEIVYARYETPDYEGYAQVIYQREGKLYEVNGSHCSCYGLEDQWKPEETSWAAIAMRPAEGYSSDTPDPVIQYAKEQVANENTTPQDLA